VQKRYVGKEDFVRILLIIQASDEITDGALA
jgi:hypothetical protein